MSRPRSPMPGCTSVIALAVTAAACVDTTSESYEHCLPVGALLPFTGSAAAAGTSMERALIFAGEAVNEQGGVGGQPVCVRSADTHSELKVGMSSARDLVLGNGGPKVASLFGPNNDDLVLRLVDLLRDQGVVGISGSDTTPSLTIAMDGGMWFRTVPSTRAVGKAFAARIAADGHDRVRVLYEGTEYGAGWASVIPAELSLLERTPLPSRSFQPGQPTYLEDLRVAFGDEVDAVVLVAMPTSGAAIVTEWANAGIGGNFYLAPALRDQVFLDNIPPGVLDNAIGVSPRLDASSYARYATAYRRRWTDEEPMQTSLFYYDALVLWALAREYATSGSGTAPTGASLALALTNVSRPPGDVVSFDDLAAAMAAARAGTDIDYQGVTGPIDFDPSGDCAEQGVEYWRVTSGGFAIMP